MTTQALAIASPLAPAWAETQVFPFQSRFAEVDGARLHYCDEGTGPVVLMLHGSPLWSYMYRDVITALRGRYRCIAVDLPGLGLSTAPIARGRAFSRNAELFEAFVRHLGLREFALVLHATAGPSGLLMATRMRERVRALIVSNTFAWNLMDIPAMRKFVRIVSSRPFGFFNVHFNLLARLTTRLARRTGRMSPDERAAVRGPYRDRIARKHLQNILTSIRTESESFADLERKLPTLRNVPTLLAFGAHDHGYQAGAIERFSKLLPRHAIEVFEHSAHFPLLDEPERVTTAFEHFLDATYAS